MASGEIDDVNELNEVEISFMGAAPGGFDWKRLAGTAIRRVWGKGWG